MSSESLARKRYWRSTLCLVLSLLVVWFLCSLGAGVIWADALDVAGKAFGRGAGWGFWFAQQGSIIIFLGLLAIFVVGMNKLDRRLADEIETARNSEKEGK